MRKYVMKYLFVISVLILIVGYLFLMGMPYRAVRYFKYPPARIPEAHGDEQILLLGKNIGWIDSQLQVKVSTKSDVRKILGDPDNPESRYIWFYPKDVPEERGRGGVFCLIFKDDRLVSPFMKTAGVTYGRPLATAYGLTETECDEAMSYVEKYVYHPSKSKKSQP